MEYINKVELQGTVGKVHDVSGIVTLSLLTVETFTSKDGLLCLRNDWHIIQVAKSNIKGELRAYSEVNVTGKLTNTEYIGADGSSKAIPKIIASNVTVLD